MYKIVACAIFKNEANYLAEWIEFHRLIGIEHFFLYNNLSNDNFEEVLAHYIKKDLVTLTNFPGNAVQLKAYNDCLVKARSAKWIAYLDIDEFLFPVDGPLFDNLESFSEFGGVAVNWVIFGSSGLSKKPDDFVINSYTLRGTLDHVVPYPHLRYKGVKRFISTSSYRPMNSHVKCIVNPNRAVEALSPHHFRYKKGFFAVDELKNKISGPWTNKVSISKFRINHYWSKSIEEMLEKYERGRADNGLKRDWSEFVNRDLIANTEKDYEILKYLKKMKRYPFNLQQIDRS